MSFILYLIGYAFVIGGIVWALVLMGINTKYIAITALILAGIAILTGAKNIRWKN